MRRLQTDSERNVRRMGLFLSAFFLLLAGAAGAQTNLLLNPGAEDSTNNWRASGKATVEDFNGRKVFVLRRERDSGDGSFSQTVSLSPSDAGKFALLIGHGSSERVNTDGAITGLPYLYGYMLPLNNPNGNSMNTYLQGQQMTARTTGKDAWVTMYGVFEVLKGTVAIQFFLNQAERKGLPLDGSAARFDDVGLFLFSTKEEALAFARWTELTSATPGCAANTPCTW